MSVKEASDSEDDDFFQNPLKRLKRKADAVHKSTPKSQFLRGIL